MHPFSGITLLFLLMALASAQRAGAQQSPFGAGLLVGMNAAQIDGDELRGFDKAGLSLGGRFAVRLAPRWEMSMDLLYSQRGSRAPYSKDNATPANKYSLHYLEVPFLVRIREWAAVTTDETAFYRLEAAAGFSYSRLIHARMTGNPFEGREDLLNANDFGWMMGFGIHLNPENSFHFRYTESINFLFDDRAALPVPRKLRGYYLSLHYLYTFRS